MAWHGTNLCNIRSAECSSLRGVTTTEFLESSCHVQNQDGGSDGTITHTTNNNSLSHTGIVISGKWRGWYVG